jgi:peptide/nickel transport system ATP-binding protein
VSSDNALCVGNLWVMFGGGALAAVRGLSLRIAPGEALGLVGESGSGKSLTALSILGILPTGASATGQIEYGGRSLLDLPESEMRHLRGSEIAMIFQDPTTALNPVSRVGDSIAQVITSHSGVDRAAARRQAVEMMERVGITNATRRARAYPHEFSGGMRQRIVIAMALATKPTLLLADEPTTALDVVVQAGILQLLDRLRREDGMATLLVSHDLGIVAGFCDRVSVMYAGQIVEEGPADQVLLHPRMPYTIGLIRSVPQVGSQARLSSIPGTPPDLGSIPSGCGFHPRCPIAGPECRHEPIPEIPVGSGHWSRCIRMAYLDQLSADSPAELGGVVEKHEAPHD